MRSLRFGTVHKYLPHVFTERYTSNKLRRVYLIELNNNNTILINQRFYAKRVRSTMDINLKCREDPIVIKLDSPEFKNIFTPEVIDLKKLFDKYNFEIRIAGGAVRDLLMGLQPKDLDFATVATPQEMKEMFIKEEIRMINMNGEKHGTITPRINDKENFEVTTLRIDMITDGRHAEVEFTTDWKLDANRRDLTINSMFLGFDGSVYDYFFGYEDLQKKRVVFVGDADVRIKEDYLRILRYFRFYGRIAEKPDNHEDATLDIIRRNASGLKNISGERIWVELKKILQGNFAAELLKRMLDLELGQYFGLPQEPNIEEFNKVIKRGGHLKLHPMTILASLLNNIDEVHHLHGRLKFANYDRDLTYFILENREKKIAERPLLPYEKLVLFSKNKNASEYVRELLKYEGNETLLEQFNNWNVPRFPITGQTLKENGVKEMKKYSLILEYLKGIWIENGYNQSKEDLVKILPTLIEDLQKELKKDK